MTYRRREIYGNIIQTPKNVEEKLTDKETFDFLPLPFLEKLKAEEMHKISLANCENQKKWKDFIDRLPDSQSETVPRALDKYWRWKMYKKYVPEERTNFRKTMSVGPKIDQFGRLPIPEELNKFRISRKTDQKLQNIKTYLKKGDGLRKSEKSNKVKLG